MGTGKSTLLTKLWQADKAYKAYWEGDLSPVELAWCSYMSKGNFSETLQKYAMFEAEIKTKTLEENGHFITAYTQILTDLPEFYQYMESFEIYNGRISFEEFRDVIYSRFEAFVGTGNIFECSFFQNSIESMMLFYCMTDDEIVEFYREAFELLKDKDFVMIYLDTKDLAGGLECIKKERTDERGNEIWYELMMRFIAESPLGRKQGYKEFSDLVEHLEQRRALELRVIREVIGEQCLVVTAKEYDVDRVLGWVNRIYVKGMNIHANKL